MDNLTLLLVSCDSYNWVLRLFLTQYKKYWDVDCPVVFVGETIPFNQDEFLNVLPGVAQWSDRLIKGLKEIKTEYVSLWLDDYLLSHRISPELLQSHIDILERYSADKIMMDRTYDDPTIYSLVPQEQNLYFFKEHSNYKNSVQPAIWKTDYLRKVLLPNQSPWGFEVDCNPYTTSLRPKILLSNIGRLYFGLCRRGGRLEVGAEEFLKQEGLSLNGT